MKNLNEYIENNKPVIIYHRGYSGIAPENTISAFDLVIKKGGKVVEFDVRLSKDDEVILLHDSTLERTSNGKGKAKYKTLSELKQLDFGSWFNINFRNERIPTLSDVFDRYGGSLFYDIELKPENNKKSVELLCKKVIYEINKKNLKNNVMLTSFSRRVIKHLRKNSNDILLGLLVDNRLDNLFLRSFIKQYSINYLIVNVRLISERYIKKVNTFTNQILSYTVNNYIDYKKCIDLGLAGIITDDPDRLIKNNLSGSKI